MEENFSMEWNMEENFSMEWKIFGMEWKWNGRKLPVWNMKKSSSIPFHTMPWSPRPKKARVLKSKTKVMLITFFDVHGIVHAEFLPQGQTINQHVYKNILRRLMRSVREKKRELWKTRSWLLHHDKAPAQNALGIREFLAKNNIAILKQPSYSPDLAPGDFFLLPKLKSSKKLVFKI